MKKFFLSHRWAAHRWNHFVIEYLGKIETELDKYYSVETRNPSDL